MPIITQLSTIPATPAGTKLSAVQGRIVKVDPQRRGNNKVGPWSFQKIVLRDHTGDTICNLRNRGELSSKWEGVWVLFEEEGEKGLITIDNYNGQNRVQIDTDAAMTQKQEPAPQASAPASAPPARGQTAPASAPASAPPARGQTAPVRPGPDFVLIKAISAFTRCLEAAGRILEQTRQRGQVAIEPDGDLTVRIATSLFIKLDKEGRIDDFPETLPEPKRREGEPDPAQNVKPVSNPEPSAPAPAPGPEPEPNQPDSDGWGVDPDVGF